ncbi:hypothetical protein E2C01_005878 [Portunus trituberculatus]|uniref:Uncharacterized protein n=1 Tax=Portunus trituberculatus TaxID=210409 RepID=A0A5B7CTI8_PORTR|nr:hypothetical protein [Portunus trituberculatus]
MYQVAVKELILPSSFNCPSLLLSFPIAHPCHTYLVHGLLQIQRLLHGLESRAPVGRSGGGHRHHGHDTATHALVLRQCSGPHLLIIRHLLEKLLEPWKRHVAAAEVVSLTKKKEEEDWSAQFLSPAEAPSRNSSTSSQRALS